MISGMLKMFGWIAVVCIVAGTLLHLLTCLNTIDSKDKAERIRGRRLCSGGSPLLGAGSPALPYRNLVYAIARTTPPSTRSAAPVVADAQALHT